MKTTRFFIPMLFLATLITLSLSARVHEIDTDAASEAAITESGPMLVAFTASWCGVCSMIKEAFNNVANSSEFKNIKFVRIDGSKAREISKKYGIVGFPTFHFRNDGEKIHEMVGVRSVKEFENHLKEDLRKKYNIATPAA